MKGWLPLSLAAGLLGAACVTINVYFPAAAAEKAADRIIDDVWGLQPQSPPAPAREPASGGSGAPRALALLADFVLPAAHAQDMNIDISSPEIARLQAQMENRFAELKPLLNSGVIGLTADGDIAARDTSTVALALRNTVRTLLGNENADRAALYREIAVANGHPEWESQIRQVFAQRWIAKAQAGWWYQDAGGAWRQK